MNIDSKKNIGSVLHGVSAGSLVIYVIFILLSDNLPSYKTTYFVFATVIIIMVIGSLLTEDIGIKGYGNLTKSENSNIYWFQIILLTLFSLLFVWLALK